MKIRSWIINVFGQNRQHTLAVGDRIRTREHGPGTVTGGAINVRLDNPCRAKNGAMNTGRTFNLSELVEVNKNA